VVLRDSDHDALQARVRIEQEPGLDTGNVAYSTVANSRR
jgi:hypothetical protein